MMKLSEKTKNFILYGIENKIERKEIYKFENVAPAATKTALIYCALSLNKSLSL